MSVRTFLMAWTTDGHFRPPVACHGQLMGLVGCTDRTRTRQRSSWEHLMQTLIPTVHASAAATTVATTDMPLVESPKVPSVESSKTTIELLAKSRRTNIAITEDDIRAVLEKETPADRLRAMFSKDETNDFTYEVKQAGYAAVGVGMMFFVLMSICGGNAAVARFLEKDKATIHNTKFLAHRAYNDAYAYGAIRVGLLYSIKSGLLVGTFLLTANTFAVYRNKSSVFEYIYAGALTCGLLRANLGLRGWFAGSVIGAVLGGIFGALNVPMMYAAKETQQDRHYRQIYENIQQEREMKLLVEAEKMNKAHTKESSAEAPAATVAAK